MRKTLIGAVASAVLVATSLAGAATAATRVDGNHFAASGVRVASQGCTDPSASPVAAPRFRIGRGPSSPPLGDRAIGWVTDGTGGFGAGPLTHVDSPSSLSELGISAVPLDEQTSGMAVVSYVAPGTEGVWKGFAALGVDGATGWHEIDATDSTFEWHHFRDGVDDGQTYFDTVPRFVAAQGGDGDGAWVGFIYGCDGNSFLVDALRVRTATEVRVLNFQGFGTRTSLMVGKRTPKKIKVTYGKRVDVAVRLQKVASHAGMAGRVRIDSRPLSAKKWQNHDKQKVGRKGASIAVRPSRSTAYRATYAGTSSYEGSTSRVLRILVKKRVNAGLVDRTVTRGHSFTATGKVAPSRAAKITLERYLKGAWRVVKRGSTDGRGHFRISAVATSLGASYWRVSARSGGGTLGAHSDVMKLTAQAPPSPGGGGGGDPDPGDPGDPPPPPGPQRGWIG